MLRPRLTEVHETFTRGGPWVWIEKYTTWIFSWSSLNYRVGQKVTKFGIFRPRPPTFCSHARTRQNIVILKKKLVKRRWLLYTCARFGELWPTNPWDGWDPPSWKSTWRRHDDGVDCWRRLRNVYDKNPQRYAKDNRTAHLTARSDKSVFFSRNLAWPHTLKFFKTNDMGE